MRFRFPSGGRLTAGVGIALVAVVLWLLFAEPGDAQATAAATANGAASTGAQAATQTGAAPTQRSAGYKAFAPGGSPYLLSAGPLERGLDIDQLKRDLAGSGKDVDAEVDRLVRLARFRDRVAMLAEVLPSLSAEERRQEAYEVLHQLPEHVAKGEILPGQALITTKALLQIGESDPEVRDALTRRLTASLEAYARQVVGPEPVTESRYQGYAQERDRMVGEMRSSIQDPEARQAAIAKREFEIRQRHY